MWQQFEFGFPTGSNPAPPNLLRSTLTNPVWNTGDRLVNITFMKGQNGHVTLFWENGLTDLTDLGLKSSIRMSYA